MAIRYRYDNEEWITIADANSYELSDVETVTGVNEIVLDVTRIQFERNGETYRYVKELVLTTEISARTYEIQLPPIFPYNNTTYERLGYTLCGRLSILTRNPNVPGSQFAQSYASTSPNLVRARNPTYLGLLVSSVENVRYRGNPQFATNCRFIAYKDSEVVYQEVRVSCPEVEIVEEDTCPEGTCEVLCGDTICCYGSDGISVFNFPAP